MYAKLVIISEKTAVKDCISDMVDILCLFYVVFMSCCMC